MEQSVQTLLRLLGGAVMGKLAEASVARHGGTRPECPHCGRPMRLVERQRGREMRGLAGDFAFARPYYQCRSCGGGIAPDDERLGIGTVSYTPALSRVAAMMVTEVPVERAAGNLSETLGATFTEAEIYRVVEALGVVAEAEIKADMTVPEAAPATPAGDTHRRGRHHELHRRRLARGEGGCCGTARAGAAARCRDRARPAQGLGPALLRRRSDRSRRVLPARGVPGPPSGLWPSRTAPRRLPW